MRIGDIVRFKQGDAFDYLVLECNYLPWSEKSSCLLHGFKLPHMERGCEVIGNCNEFEFIRRPSLAELLTSNDEDVRLFALTLTEESFNDSCA